VIIYVFTFKILFLKNLFVYHLADGETQFEKSVKTESEYMQLYSMYMVSRVNFSKEQQLLSNNFSKNNCLITLAKNNCLITLAKNNCLITLARTTV